MARQASIGPDQDAHLARLIASAAKRKRWERPAVLAFDHRRPVQDLAGRRAPEDRIPDLNDSWSAGRRDEEALGLQSHVGASSTAPTARTALRASGRGWWLGPGGSAGSRPLEFEGAAPSEPPRDWLASRS